MADLITHVCSAVLWTALPWPTRQRVGASFRSASGDADGRQGPRRQRSGGGDGEGGAQRGEVALFVAGVCLPDLLSRVPSMAITWLRWTMPAIPEWAIYPWGPLHMPVGIVLTSVLAGFLFPERGRGRVVRALVGGGMLHMALDVLQRHLGVGYLLLYPFSTWDWEAGVIGSEDTVRAVPVVLPVTVLVAWLRWGRGRPPAAGRSARRGDAALD